MILVENFASLPGSRTRDISVAEIPRREPSSQSRLTTRRCASVWSVDWEEAARGGTRGVVYIPLPARKEGTQGTGEWSSSDRGPGDEGKCPRQLSLGVAQGTRLQQILPVCFHPRCYKLSGYLCLDDLRSDPGTNKTKINKVNAARHPRPWISKMPCQLLLTPLPCNQNLAPRKTDQPK